MTTNYDVIIIGGGHNGLTLACELAQKDQKVLVLEKQGHLGGVADLISDTSMVSAFALKSLSLVKEKLPRAQDAVRLAVPLKAGGNILISANSQKTSESLLGTSPKDAESYKSFSQFISSIRQPIIELLKNPPPKFEGMSGSDKWRLLLGALKIRGLGKKIMLELLRVPTMSISDWLNEWFETEELKAALSIDALAFTNRGPWSPGTTFNFLIAEVLRSDPLQGGSRALVAALENRSKELGVEVRLDHGVANILVNPQGTKGVRLASGKEIYSQKVVATCDPRSTFLKLIPKSSMSLNLRQQAKSFRAIGSTGVANLVVNNIPSKFVNTAFTWRFVNSMEDIEKAHCATKYGEIADELAFDFYIQGSSLKVNCHFLPYLEGERNNELRSQLQEKVENKLKQFLPDCKIDSADYLTPKDIEDRFSLSGGHLQHGEQAIDQMLVRPFPESARYATPIAGLFQCGSGSFPGGNLTCLPGHLAAKLV